MPRRRKVEVAKVRASLSSVCPTCGYETGPAEVLRGVDLDDVGADAQRVRCPKCAWSS